MLLSKAVHCGMRGRVIRETVKPITMQYTCSLTWKIDKLTNLLLMNVGGGEVNETTFHTLRTEHNGNKCNPTYKRFKHSKLPIIKLQIGHGVLARKT